MDIRVRKEANMQCMSDKCSNELAGRQKTFCSDKCRMAQSRTSKTHEDGSGCSKSNKPEQSTSRTQSRTDKVSELQPAYQMTDFEREHYKLKLKSGEYNPVSKPGDSHYSQQSDLNTCSDCGCSLKWDAMTICIDCVTPPHQLETDTELELRQQAIHKRNAATRAKLAATPLAKLKGWIPVWRQAQG